MLRKHKRYKSAPWTVMTFPGAECRREQLYAAGDMRLIRKQSICYLKKAAFKIILESFNGVNFCKTKMLQYISFINRLKNIVNGLAQNHRNMYRHSCCDR